MYFKELSSELAIYRQPRLTRLLLVLLCGFFLFIGLINVFNSDEAKSLPIWVSGFICWLGWSGSFGGYVCRFDLAKQTLELKSSSLYESPRVHRRPVCLSQATLPDSFKLS